MSVVDVSREITGKRSCHFCPSVVRFRLKMPALLQRPHYSTYYRSIVKSKFTDALALPVSTLTVHQRNRTASSLPTGCISSEADSGFRESSISYILIIAVKNNHLRDLYHQNFLMSHLTLFQ